MAGPDGVLETILRGGKKAGWNGVLVSQAWCFLHALHEDFPDDVDSPTGDWPGFGPADDGLAFVRAPAGDGSEFTRLVYRSLRLAWAAHPHTSCYRPHEAVPMLHYLYPMVCGITAGVVEPDAVALVERVFGPTSAVREAIRAYTRVPGIGRLFDAAEEKLRPSGRRDKGGRR